MRVDFSKNHGPLEVRHESDKCRDYINNPLTPEEIGSLRRSYVQGAGGDGGGHNPNNLSSHFRGHVMPNVNHQGVHFPIGMIASNSNNFGINELTAQLVALAQQSGLPLTPTAATATASFMALTSQNNPSGTQASPGMPNLSSVLAALQGAAVQTGLLPHMNNANQGVMGSLQPASSHSSSVSMRSPANNNGSTVLIVSNLNEDVSFV